MLVVEVVNSTRPLHGNSLTERFLLFFLGVKPFSKKIAVSLDLLPRLFRLVVIVIFPIVTLGRWELRQELVQ